MYNWRPYVPVAQRRAKAVKALQKLAKKGTKIQPVEIEGRTIARSFWGKGWCSHLESFSDYSNRLPRGRTYVRNGSVCHLEILPGKLDAFVAGSSLYRVTVTIDALKPAVWKAIKEQCAGRVGSMLELLQGKFSDEVMTIVTDRESGLFPKPREIKLGCSCPDWAVMCKHVAAVLYAVGNRLDAEPELLFLLRQVDASDLIATELALGDAPASTSDALAGDSLGAIFGIELDDAPQPETASRPAAKKRASKTASPKSKKPVAAKATMQPRTKKKAPFMPTGKRIARMRRALRMDVDEFAEALGVTPATVYRWERVKGRLRIQSRPLQALHRLREEKGLD